MGPIDTKKKDRQDGWCGKSAATWNGVGRARLMYDGIGRGVVGTVGSERSSVVKPQGWILYLYNFNTGVAIEMGSGRR